MEQGLKLTKWLSLRQTPFSMGNCVVVGDGFYMQFSSNPVRTSEMNLINEHNPPKKL